MAFELLAWIYLSVVCLVWGNLFVHLFFGRSQESPEFDFPMRCVMGMSLIGIVALYLSLFIPLGGAVKWILQVPVLLFFLSAANRQTFYLQVIKPFANCSALDFFLLTVSVVMVLFLSTSPIIHPDSLHYHIYSIRVFDQFGTIPGIVNMQLEFGFQSLWFAVLSVFDFSYLQTGISYPLSGCLLCWFFIFLISKLANANDPLGHAGKGVSAAAYLVLFLFTCLSWTQVRLTASSASPDFVAAVCILLAFYFFMRKPDSDKNGYGFYLALFFALTAISIKLSAIFILLMLVYIMAYGLVKRRFRLTRMAFLLMLFFLTPVIIRNILSTGYPFFPSAFADIFHPDWKLPEARLTNFRHYITAYARFPLSGSGSEAAYRLPFSNWLPLWWRHLQLMDKVLVLALTIGGFLNLILFKKWIKAFGIKSFAAFMIALSGTVLWFVNAPDPRFGTGFLLPLLYFQYSPYFVSGQFGESRLFFKTIYCLKFMAVLMIAGYIVYRGIYFFHPQQLIFPDGVKKTMPVRPDCNDYMKSMLFGDSSATFRLPDSCKTFIDRGSSLKAGFRPLD
ncbi:MAG: LIC_10190 family membrane protein [Chitinophagales bacterium]